MKMLKNTQITKNKKAYFDYDIIETWEAWVELKWYEVKSVRLWHVNLKWRRTFCKKYACDSLENTSK